MGQLGTREEEAPQITCSSARVFSTRSSGPAKEDTNNDESLPTDIKKTVDAIVQKHKGEFAREVQNLGDIHFGLMSEDIYSTVYQLIQCSQAHPVSIPKAVVDHRSNYANSSPGAREHSPEATGGVVATETVPVAHREENIAHSSDRNNFMAETDIPSIDEAALGIQVAMSYATEPLKPSCCTVQSPTSIMCSKVLFNPGTTDTSPDDGAFLGTSQQEEPNLTVDSSDHTPISNNFSEEPYPDDVSNTGPSTIDKQKRKKRFAKKPCDSQESFILNVDQSTQLFYEKYLGNKFLKTKKASENTIVVDINGHIITYEKFYESFKARGDISNEVMAAFVEVFNQRVDKDTDDKNSRPKISFSPYFATKLNVSPEKFDVKSVCSELRKMNKKYNLAKCDLLHFPTVHDNHWMLLCVNLLFKKINFLDSLEKVDKSKKSRMASNMVKNFHKACIETKCLNFDLASFSKEPANLPQQTTTFDCGVFTILYMGVWNGQKFKEFDAAMISEFRKVVAHEIVSSSSNDMTTEVQNPVVLNVLFDMYINGRCLKLLLHMYINGSYTLWILFNAAF